MGKPTMFTNDRLIKSILLTALFLVSAIVIAKDNLMIHKKFVFKLNKKKIWLALTDANELGKWWGKGVLLEPLIGGRFHEPWGKQQLATGKVIRIKHDDFITFSWQEKYWDSSEETVCTFILKQIKGNTILEVKHSGWETFKDLKKRKKMINGFSKGWDNLLSRLQKYILSS